MKKKILIVFLICCMLLGVPSAAMAAGVPSPNDDWEHYLIFANNSSIPFSSHCEDCASAEYAALVYYCVDKDYENLEPIYFSLDENGAITSIYLPQYSDPSYSFSFRWFFYYSTDTYTGWGLHTTSTGSSSTSSVDGYLIRSFDNPILISSIFDSSNSDFLIYGTDENFPPAPPLVNLTEELIQKTPEALDLDGKLKILVPFGISCLALLISLLLLLRVLRRFLG